MLSKFFPLLVIGLWGVIVLPLPNRASAVIPLTRAEIQNLRNLVQFIPKNSAQKRPARKLDAMIPGDGLSTGRSSLVDLRFNDGSLARIGEQAVFQFLPKTRDFKLSNGTVLLLIPPGRGQTRIQTPSAAAAIRGSALFVRHNQQTDTTIVGALTSSGIEVSNKEASQTLVLQAGQMMVIVKGKFQSLYDFDLRNFYETSDLVRELDLNRQNPVPTPDPAINSVQAETVAALEAQPPITGEGVIENPSFVQLTISPSNSPSNDVIKKDNPSANSSDKTGQASTNTEQQSTTNGNNSNVNTENNNTGVDSSKTPTEPQTSSEQSKPRETGGTTTTPKPTPSGTGTTTPEPTPGETGTTTPEPTPGETGTTTPEPTPGETGTTTPEPTPSGTGTTTPEPTPSGTGTTTPEPTPSGTGTTTPEPTPSGTGTTTPEPTPSGTGTTTPEPTPSGTGTTTPEPTPSGTGTTTPEPTPSESGTTTPEPTPSGTGTTTPEPTPSESGTTTTPEQSTNKIKLLR